MIDEIFYQSAIKIRRQYLKVTNNMTFYQGKAKVVSDNLGDIIKRIDDIKESTNPENSEFSAESAVNELVRILKEVEEEAKRLEEMVDPLNSEMEKLALEEQELWRNIKEKHYNISEDDIISSVKERLIRENIS
jgi:predicted nuclease with TOPRIM domain